MKFSALLLIAVLLTPFQARAADEFGARFGNTAPAALGEPASKNPALIAFTPEQLEKIETAAGDSKQNDSKQSNEQFGPPAPDNFLMSPPPPAAPQQ